jgi:hypothetical protein
VRFCHGFQRVPFRRWAYAILLPEVCLIYLPGFAGQLPGSGTGTTHRDYKQIATLKVQYPYIPIRYGCTLGKGTHEMSNVRPRIARIWRGRTTPEIAETYHEYLLEVGFPPLLEHALGAEMFREDREGETEFVTISYWESIEAMSRFAGEDPRKIHHLPRDPELLIELPEAVQVMHIVTGSWPGFPGNQ